MFGGFRQNNRQHDANCSLFCTFLPPVSQSKYRAQASLFGAYAHFQLASAHFCTILLALSRFDDRVQVSLSDAYSHFRLASSRFCMISLALVRNKAPMKCPLIHTFYSLLHTFTDLCALLCIQHANLKYVSAQFKLAFAHFCMLSSCMHSEIVDVRSWWLDTKPTLRLLSSLLAGCWAAFFNRSYYLTSSSAPAGQHNVRTSETCSCMLHVTKVTRQTSVRNRHHMDRMWCWQCAPHAQQYQSKARHALAGKLHTRVARCKIAQLGNWVGLGM